MAHSDYVHFTKERRRAAPIVIEGLVASSHYGPRWPMAELKALRPGWSIRDWCVLAGTHPRSWTRWAHIGLPDEIADRVAVRLGLHPSAIWPTWCDIDIEEEAA